MLVTLCVRGESGCPYGSQMPANGLGRFGVCGPVARVSALRSVALRVARFGVEHARSNGHG